MDAFRPSKSLGQNFLVDPNLRRKFVDALELPEGATVFEIGPGQGALTEELFGRARRVVAVERDAELAAALRRRWGMRDDFVLLTGDCLDLDLSEVLWGEGPFFLLSNLPYAVTSPLLRWIFFQKVPLRRLVLGMQKEVGQRLIASPRTKDYGRLTVLAALWGTARRLFDLPASAFRPRPRVLSSVLRLDPHDVPPLEPALWEALEGFTAVAFGQRRKMLGKVLSTGLSLPRPEVDRLLAAADLSPDVRPDAISPDQCFRLVRVFVEAGAFPRAGALSEGRETPKRA